MKTIQDYIEEEIKKFEKHFCGEYDRLWRENTAMKAETSCEEEIKFFLKTSLQRIAKITAEEIVPEKKLAQEDDDIIDTAKKIGYFESLITIQTKIKEFGI